jgi:hypothetical protein
MSENGQWKTRNVSKQRETRHMYDEIYLMDETPEAFLVVVKNGKVETQE